ncbi:hypothetical protein C3488_30300 [Streptomyces sp. Ru72]|nr:hypothetical protein C3488_30300 [Streptomyces sp. Ru72]
MLSVPSVVPVIVVIVTVADVTGVVTVATVIPAVVAAVAPVAPVAPVIVVAVVRLDGGVVDHRRRARHRDPAACRAGQHHRAGDQCDPASDVRHRVSPCSQARRPSFVLICSSLRRTS